MNATILDTETTPLPEILQDQPISRITYEGVEYVFLGTAHVSRNSMEAVQSIIEHETFDAIAVELCEGRAQNIKNPEAFKRMDLFQVIRQGKAGMVAASLALASFQQRLAEQYGIEPGAEMKAAMQGAETHNLPVWLVDREIGITLKRAWRHLRWRDKWNVLISLVASVIEREDIDKEDIEKLKQGDMLESTFSEFAANSGSLYKSLIEERDQFMAARLREQAATQPDVKKVLVVIGAGHLKGASRQLVELQGEPKEQRIELEQLPVRARWPKWLAFGIFFAIFAAIGWAFHRNMAMGTAALKTWIFATGGLAGCGAILAGGHPLSIIASAIAAPFKPFRPGIPAGGVGALAETWIRKPTVADFEALRKDISHWKGWWKNRVARVFLLFMLVNIGTMIGEYTAGIHIFSSLF